MSNIPGGRPRASSDGDILDDGLRNTFFGNVNEIQTEAINIHHGNRSRPVLRKPNKSGSSSSHDGLDLDVQEDFDSDDEISSQSHNSSFTTRTNKSIFSFKSVRKAVTRRFAKEPNSNRFLPSSSKKALPKTFDLAKVWTPELRGLGYSSVNGKENARLEKSTMSTARPLITDPNVSMTVPKWKRTPGVLGITNHGNSCFMNAVLQCLSNTDSFTEYFVKEFYKSDLKHSKNGKKSVFRSSQGEVTEQLGMLLKSLWSGKYSSEVSREFKSIVGKFSGQYKGDHQHDAQEFLLWLLDRIHEDVCTYLKKKQKPQKSPAAIKSDEEAASEAATVNGESFVVRLFQALHASTLTCPTCGRRSSTFDPYLCVSLPLPQRCPRQVTLVVVPYESSSITSHSNSSGGRGRLRNAGGLRVAMTLNQYDTVGELKTRLCAEVPGLDLKAKQLILVQLREDGFGSTYSNEQPVSDIGEGESLYALEAAFCSDSAGDMDAAGDEHSNGVTGRMGAQDEFNTPLTQVMVVHVELSPGSNRSYRFSSPSMLKVRRDITWKGLQKEILHKMGNAVFEGVLSQKLSAIFKLRVYDGSSRRNSLSSDIEMPLYTQDVERAYETLNEAFGPLHIKLVVEWDIKTKKIIVEDGREYVEVHRSVHDAQNSHPGQMKVSLDECFKLYTQEERLTGEDAWVCPHCKQQQQGTIKTLGLWSLPDILVLHLKRFKQTGLRRSKLNTLVDFPVEGLDMSPYLAKRKNGSNSSSPTEDNGLSSPFLRPDDLTYDLLSVSNHYGDMMGGHYMAVCKSPVDGIWREFNDFDVRRLNEGEPIATKEAYLLFYQRRSLGKDINHRLFTGDHWAFSLSLAPSEIREDGSSSGGSTPRGEVIPNIPPAPTSTLYPRRRSLHRSVSPSLHKQGVREHGTARRPASSSRPLTPQPHRKPVIPYSETRFSDGDDDYNDDLSPSSPTRTTSPSRSGTTRRSRPVQRQASEPGRRPRKPDSNQIDFVKPKDPPPKSYDRYSQWDDKGRETISNGKSGRKSDAGTIFNSHTTDKNKGPTVVASRHESQGLSSVTSTSSRHHQLSHSNSLESDSKYPSYDRNNYLDLSNTRHLSSFEPASSLRVKLDEKDVSELSSHPQSHSGHDILSAATARKRLAQRIDLDSKAEDPQPFSFTNSSRDSYVRQSSRRYNTQKSFEMAKQNLLSLDSELSKFRLLSVDRLNGHHPSLDLDKSKAEDQGRWDKISDNLNNNSKFMHSNGYSRLDSDVEEEEEEELDELAPRTSLQTQIHNKYDTVIGLAEKHFGPPSYKKEKYVSLLSKDDLPALSSDLSQVSKYATMGRRVTDYGTRGTVSHLLDQDRPLRDIPRSSTDYNIHYSLANHDLPAPPSPTPPRGPGEERTFTATGRVMERGVDSIPASTFASSFPYTSYSAGRLTDRDIQALQAYEHAGRTGVLDRRSGGVGTLPGYASDSGIRKSRHNFRPPRGTWGILPPRVKDSVSTAIPTPCLRESSV